MARQTMINTADDMRWLRDVHLPRLPAKYKSAIIVGNEDYPERIEVYEKRNPVVADVPLIFKADDDDVFKETAKAHHATKKPKIGYFIRSRGPGGVEFDEVYVYGPTRRSDEGIVGHDLRVRPTRLGPGTYTSVVSPDDVEWTKPLGHQPTTQEIKRDVDRILAEAARRK